MEGKPSDFGKFIRRKKKGKEINVHDFGTCNLIIFKKEFYKPIWCL